MAIVTQHYGVMSPSLQLAYTLLACESVADYDFLGFTDAVARGDEFIILYIGTDGDEEGYVFARRVKHPGDEGWLPLCALSAMSFRRQVACTLFAREYITDWKRLGFAAAIAAGDELIIRYIGTDREERGYIYARRARDPGDEGWLLLRALTNKRDTTDAIPQPSLPSGWQPAQVYAATCVHNYNNSVRTQYSPGVVINAQHDCAMSSDTQPVSVQECRAQPLALCDLKICVAGDSGLQLNRSKGTTSFQKELQALLGPHAEVHRFPAEGATAIGSFLHSMQSFDVVVIVWLLNEFFDNRNKLLATYPLSIDAAARGLAQELKRFPYHLAVIGGSAALWNVPERFDAWANRVCDIFTSEGIAVDSGIDCFSDLTMTKDGWHACSTPENKNQMAAYYARLVTLLVAEPF